MRCSTGCSHRKVDNITLNKHAVIEHQSLENKSPPIDETSKDMSRTAIPSLHRDFRCKNTHCVFEDGSCPTVFHLADELQAERYDLKACLLKNDLCIPN